MALKGHFDADFSSFYDACAKAQVAIKGFQGDVDAVNASMSRMVDEFSGRKIITEATLMAQAVEDIGGVGKLTAAELQRVGAVAAEAAEKMRAWGGEIPANIQKLADAAANAATSASTGSSALASFGESALATATGMFTAEAAMRLFDKAMGAAVDTAKELWNVTLTGSAVASVEENFKNLTAQVGSLDTVLDTLRAGTHNTITDFDLMKAVNRDLTAGMVLTEAQYRTLADGAFALAQAENIDVKAAFDKVNDAMLTGRTRGLAAISVRVDQKDAEEKYATSMGHTADQLTDTGKLEATRLATLDSITAATGRLGTQTDGLGERVQQASVTWQNFENDLGKALATSKVLDTALSGVRDMLIEAFGGDQKSMIVAIKTALEDTLIALVDVGKVGVEIAGDLALGWFAVQKVVGDVVQAYDLLNLGAMKFERFKITSSNVLGLSPEAAKQLQEINADIAESTKRIDERGAALQGMDAKQDAIRASTEKWKVKLDELQTKMEASRTTTENTTEATQNLAGAHTDAAAATGAHTDQNFKLNEADKKLATAYEELASAGDGWKGTLDTIDGAVVESIISYRNAGVSMQALKLIYSDLSDAQLASAERERTSRETTAKQAAKLLEEQYKLEAKTAEMTTKLWDDYDVTRIKQMGSATDVARAENDKRYNDAAATAIKMGIVDAQYWDALEARWKQGNDAISIDWAALNKTAQTQSQAALQAIADKAKATYDEALTHVGTWSAGAIDKFRVTAEAAQRAATDFGTAWAENADKATKATNNHATAAQKSFKDLVTGTQADLQAHMADLQGMSQEDSDRAVTLYSEAFYQMNLRVNYLSKDINGVSTQMIEMGEAGAAAAQTMESAWVGAIHAITMASQAAAISQSAKPYADTAEDRLKLLADDQQKYGAGAISIVGLFGGVNPIQTRDSGGPVVAGTSYLIGGGNAPEIFTPGASGYVTPTEATRAPLTTGSEGGRVSVTNVFNIVDTESNITRRVSANITRSIMAAQKL